MESLGYAINSMLDARLSGGNSLRLTVTTSSMMPILMPGDHVFVQGMPGKSARLGDMVLIKTGDQWLVHRLIDQMLVDGAWRLVTKGDHHSIVDQIWTEGDIRGIIISTEHDERIILWQRNWVCWMSRLLAWLSRHEASARRASPGVFRNVSLRGWHIALRLSALIVRGLACTSSG